ncbi:MAG TPA: Crp/Fnr family transcriptional regulator [Bryobacteraceae bacterium]|jgi:CRP/FNR family transcriptional regulator|nr:Crp/Fnr family transcriptional regulator [Bryobacteraceae bacterium]
MATTLADLFRGEMLQFDGVSRFSPSRRFTAIFRQSDPADSIFFVSAGLVKLFNRGHDNKEVTLRIAAPGEWFGEDALTENATRGSSAEVVQEAVIFTIPRTVLSAFAAKRPEFWPLVVNSLAERLRSAEEKVQLLCTADVETRILHFVRSLASRLKDDGQSSHFSIPLSQSELASLIGATRETTSTALNMLARKGVLYLRRRLMVIPSLEALEPSPAEEAAEALSASAQAGSRP